MSSGSKAMRLSAAVVLLRRCAPASAGAANFEVLLAQRSSRMQSFASVYVFPGGVAEEADSALAAQQRPASSAPKVTAARELFEEVGILLGTHADDDKPHLARAVSMDDAARQQWQTRVHDDADSFAELLQDTATTPAVDALHHWVSFITPAIEKRRFHTDFFVAVVDDCDVAIDGGETVHYEWKTPAEAIRRNEAGEMALLPPQLYVLRGLSDFQDVDALVAHAAQRPALIPILPVHVPDDDVEGLVLVYPGDALHPLFPGAEGDRRRITATFPMGMGYVWDCNLDAEPTIEAWEQRQQQAKSSKL